MRAGNEDGSERRDMGFSGLDRVENRDRDRLMMLTCMLCGVGDGCVLRCEANGA
jgi:hypothetical protein